MILPLLEVVPVVFGTEAAAKRTALIVTVAEFVLSLGLWCTHDPANGGMQLVSQLAWLPKWGISHHVGL